MRLGVTLVAALLVGLAAGRLVTMLIDRFLVVYPLAGRSATVATRCRRCEQLLAAALFCWTVQRSGLDWVVLPPLLLIVALLVLSVIDLHLYHLPGIITFLAFGVSLVAIVFVSLLAGEPAAIGLALLGSLGFFGLLLVAHAISPRGLGFGDVKLALLLGLHLGWSAGMVQQDWTSVASLVLLALLFASLGGLVMGIVVALLRHRRNVLVDPEAEDADAPDSETGSETAGRDKGAEAGVSDRVSVVAGRSLLLTNFPFGPALAAATLVTVLYSKALLL